MSRAVLGLGIVASLIAPVQSEAAQPKLPSDLIGDWCFTTRSGVSSISYEATGYSGSADGEGFGCKVKSVRRLSLAAHGGKMWRVVFVCTGEFGQVHVNSLILVQA